ncbi:MAG: phosphoribosylamine--glycine ligase [Candidatus Omnitrophota bacterium]
MKVLVVGSGGREHTLCWKIAQSNKVKKLYCAPGNGGISQVAECVDIKADDSSGLKDFAKREGIDLTIVGPEGPLVAGIVDEFKDEGLKIFGPSKYCANLEGSKIFSKEIMNEFCIPTAAFEVFDCADLAKAYIKEKAAPVVIKADGLCAGKGVVVCHSENEAFSAVDRIMNDKEFGAAGEKIIVEDCLSGEEASIIVVSDGKNFVSFPSSQDHKRAFDNDEGPNTGGMGAYSPAPIITDSLSKDIDKNIIKPIIDGLSAKGTPYTGVLYIGLMLTESGPYVLEFNVRFGDPETQVIVPRLATDIIDLIQAAIDGNLKDIKVEFDKRACVCVVCASGGYPGSYKKGVPIKGIEEAEAFYDIIVFHAGTKLSKRDMLDTAYETNGGRVLGITAFGNDIKQAIDRVYEGCSKIKFEGMFYRKDIGCKAIKKGYKF